MSDVTEKQGRYFMVSPEKKVIPISAKLFEAVEQFVKPNNKLGILEITFKAGGICAIKKIEYV
jgi:hypothetical protein